MKFFTIVYLIYQLYDAYIRTEFSLWLINIKLFKSFKDFKIQTDLFRYFKGSWEISFAFTNGTTLQMCMYEVYSCIFQLEIFTTNLLCWRHCIDNKKE